MTLPPRLAQLGRHDRVRRRAADLPPHADRHAVGVVEAASSSRSCTCKPQHDHGRAARHRPVVHARRREVADAARGRGRPARAGEAVRPAHRRARRRQGRASPRSQRGDRRRGLRARRARGAGPRASAPSDWISLPGRVDDATLLDLYRRAWVVASTSAHEGWGMTITEAAACGTPAVATRIAGHADAVVDGGPASSSTTRTSSARRDRARARRRRGSAGARSRRGARARAPVHVGRDRARHARGARRRSNEAPPDVSSTTGAAELPPERATPASTTRRGRRRDVTRSVARAALGYVAARGARVRAAAAHATGQGRRRHEAVPLPRSRRGCSSAPRRCGTRTSGWAPSPTRTSATCSRWGRTTGCSSKLGVPDWVAQRLWLGSLLFFARRRRAVPAAHARPARPGCRRRRARVHVHAVLARLLGAHLGVPVAVGRAAVDDRAARVKALRDGGWRYPALFALVVQLVGGVNATALIFAGVGPVLWILYAWLVDARGRLAARARRHAADRRAHAAHVAVVDRRPLVQGAYGLDVLKYTETVKAVAAASFPNEVLRGLGYWFFYGSDRLGPWIEAASALHAAARGDPRGLRARRRSRCSRPRSLRWRHRVFFVAAAARRRGHRGRAVTRTQTRRRSASVFKAFANVVDRGSRACAAPAARCRSSCSALAVLLGARRRTSRSRALRDAGTACARRGASSASSSLLIVVNLPALYDGTCYGKNLERPEDVPEYWTDATHALDRGRTRHRVLEVPGADFASYPWGNTVDPITPGLMDRPYVARELIPYGTAGTADLLNAFDRRLQEGVADRTGVADVLRRMGVGDVVLRNDIQYERYDLVRPPSSPGCSRTSRDSGAPPGTARRRRSRPGSRRRRLRAVDEIQLASPPDEPRAPGASCTRSMTRRRSCARSRRDRSLMVAGDGEGLVDAADVGLLDGQRRRALLRVVPDGRGAARRDRHRTRRSSHRLEPRSGRASGARCARTSATPSRRGRQPLVDDPSDARLPLFPGETVDAYDHDQQRRDQEHPGQRVRQPDHLHARRPAVRALDGDVEHRVARRGVRRRRSASSSA